MNIELTEKEYDYLRTIIGMDQRLKNERLLNAAASSSRNFNDPDMMLVDGILDAMSDGQLKALMEQATLQIHTIKRCGKCGATLPLQIDCGVDGCPNED